MHPLNLLKGLAPGWRLVSVVMGVTTILWLWAMSSGATGLAMAPIHSVSLLLANWAIALLSVILLSTTRSRSIERLFGGLDRAVRLHRFLAPTAIVVTIVHTLMYLPAAYAEGRGAAPLLIPFWSEDLAEAMTALVFWLLLGWTAIAYSKRFRYERWLLLHGLLGPIFLATSAHALLHGPTIQSFEPLRFWMWLLVLVGFLSWAYRVLLYPFIAPRFLYEVGEVNLPGGNTVELKLKPKSRRMMYEPGTFAFIRRPLGAGGEAIREFHPFSISSSPTERFLRFSIRMVGDFTRSLQTLKPGDPIEVFGPFGGFTPHRYGEYRRLVCIGAGIGITPFLSMMRFETASDDFRRIWLWYVARDADGAPYDAELKDTVARADSWVDYELWLTGERGRLTAEKVMQTVAPFDDVAVMLCGTPGFVRSMVQQFRDLGIPKERLIYEDLHFH